MTDAIVDVLRHTGQESLIQHLLSLPNSEQPKFLDELSRIDWREVQLMYRSARTPDDPAAAAALAQRAQSPQTVVKLPANDADRQRWTDAVAAGEAALRNGEVAAILVAGGQGTRLGFDGPKGMFPVGPITSRSLFQGFCEQLRSLQRQYGRRIRYGVMTSSATHDPTVAYFQQRGDFGLEPGQLTFFQQANFPAVDEQTGAALLSAPGTLALSPDGHGGLLAALDRSGWLKQCASEGVRWFFYHQVDNPLVQMCDPAFIGWHILQQSDVSTKVIAKRSAGEKMGVLAQVDGATRIIEYSDMPAEVAQATDEQGQLQLWAGNTGMHVFSVQFLEKRLGEQSPLPIHTARKAVAYLNAAGERVAPKTPNALKFERFIFDLLPMASRALVLEASREEEFSPVKNASGDDSPDSSRAAISARNRRWLAAAGHQTLPDAKIEISPLFARTETELKQQRDVGDTLQRSVLLDSRE